MAEVYTGVKFKTIYQNKFKANKEEQKIIKELINVGKKLGSLGFEDENGGNFSYRVKRGIIIKTTGSYPHKLKIKDFVLMIGFSANKVFVYGEKEPSSEARLHYKIYQARDDIKCVLHSHDNLAIESKEKIKEAVYIKEFPYGSLDSARAIKKASLKGNYIIMKNHGVFSLGKNILQAYNLIYKNHEKFKKIRKTSA